MACSAIALVVATALLAKQAQVVREAMVRQAALNGWEGRLQHVLLSLTEAETGQRGYLLTGGREYLEPYRKALEELPQLQEKLDTIPLSDPTVAGRILDIHQKAAAKLAELAGTIRLHDEGQGEAALALVRTHTGRLYMEQLHADIDAVAAIVRTNRTASNASVVAGSLATERLAIVTVTVLIVTLVLAALQIAALMTAQSRFEAALAASEKFVRTITDSVPVRMAYFDTRQRFQFVNRALCARFDEPREALIGRTLGEVTQGTSAAAVTSSLQSALAGTPQRIEYPDILPSGAAQHIETQLIPDLGPKGEVRGVFGIGVDISHLKTVESALRELTEVFDNTPDYVAQADDRGRLNYLNPAARRGLGLAADASVEGRVFSEFFTSDTNQRWADEILPAVRKDGVWVGETAVVLRDDRTVPVSHMVIAHRDSDGRLTRYSSILRDISIEVAARRELGRQTAALNAIVDAIPAMVGVCDADFRYQLVNRSYERWRGRDRREFIGHTLEEMLEPGEFERSLPFARRALAGETVSYEIENVWGVDARHMSITYIPLRLGDGTIGGFVGMFEDITQHREENLRLLLLSERDPLTGLLNKMGFESYLSKKMLQGAGRSLAILYIDLDRFKPINDTYGHATGDEVLRHFATRLHSVVRPTDAVARLGGDEFAVVLTGIRSVESAATVARKIVELAGRTMLIGDHELEVGASVGVAFDAEAAGGWNELVARADTMVYRAKAEGRGRYALPQ